MKQATVFFILFFVIESAIAGATIVPTLDQAGRKGDIARMAKEKAVAKFDSADENKDGKLSKDEVSKSQPFMSQNFDKLDIDKDGFLNWEEYVGHNRWPK